MMYRHKYVVEERSKKPERLVDATHRHGGGEHCCGLKTGLVWSALSRQPKIT